MQPPKELKQNPLALAPAPPSLESSSHTLLRRWTALAEGSSCCKKRNWQRWARAWAAQGWTRQVCPYLPQPAAGPLDPPPAQLPTGRPPLSPKQLSRVGMALRYRFSDLLRLLKARLAAMQHFDDATAVRQCANLLQEMVGGGEEGEGEPWRDGEGPFGRGEGDAP